MPKHRLQLWLEELSWNGNRGCHDGESVVVAVIDTKINYEHPDLKGKVLESYSISNGKFKKDDTLNKNTSNHGTAVAGIIAAYPLNEDGVIGIAPKSKLISIEIAQDTSNEISVESLQKSIDLAVELGVDIINISCGTKKSDATLQDSVKRACDRGIIIVAAAGNEMENDILFPAAYENVIAVGAKNRDNEIISPKGNLVKDVIYLPGEYIVTASATKGYDSVSGTSASTAIMTGIVALILEESPNVKSNEIVELFINEKYVNIYEILKNF